LTGFSGNVAATLALIALANNRAVQSKAISGLNVGIVILGFRG
jgi:hypothetical protein